MDFFDRIEHAVSVTSWSLRWRRAFLLTLPISGPLWLLLKVAWTFFLLAWYSQLLVFYQLKKTLWDKRPDEEDNRA